jgi:hypothetical protein
MSSESTGRPPGTLRTGIFPVTIVPATPLSDSATATVFTFLDRCPSHTPDSHRERVKYGDAMVKGW